MIRKRKKPLTLSFRVETDIGSQLRKEAQAENISIHEVSRQRLLSSLAEQPLRDELLEIKEALSALHDLLQDLFLVLDHEDNETLSDETTAEEENCAFE